MIGSGPAAAFAVKNLIDIEEVLVIEKGSYDRKLNDVAANLKCNVGQSNTLKFAEMVGGASNYWGGGFIRFDKIDFNEKGREHFNKWPFPPKELDHYYQKALKICGVDIKQDSETFLSSLKTQPLVQQNVPFNVCTLLNMPNVKIVKNHEAIRLNLIGEKIDSIVVKNIENNEILSVTGDVYILAGGTINNIRILHNTFYFFSKIIPPLLGKNIGTHPKIYLGITKISNKYMNGSFFKVEAKQKIWKQYGLPDEILSKYKLPNHSIRFEPIMASRLNEMRLRIARYILNAKVLDENSLIFEILKISTERIVNMISSLISSNRYRVRLYLDQKKDTQIHCVCELGEEYQLPNFQLKVAETAIKNLEINQFCEQFSILFRSDTNEELNLKKINLDNTTVVHSHFTGGCIMGSDPKQSIVNQNCQVHGIDNLFVSGPSVFTTHSFCNPFLTIAALSLRLGEFINSKFSS